MRDVDDSRIHFCMFIKRHTSDYLKSRISPVIWEQFFKGFGDKPEKGLLVMFIEVEQPKKVGWSERFRRSKVKNEPGMGMAKSGKGGKKGDVDVVQEGDLPAYSESKSIA